MAPGPAGGPADRVAAGVPPGFPPFASAPGRVGAAGRVWKPRTPRNPAAVPARISSGARFMAVLQVWSQGVCLVVDGLIGYAEPAHQADDLGHESFRAAHVHVPLGQ